MRIFRYFFITLFIFSCCPEGSIKKNVRKEAYKMFEGLEDWHDDLKTRTKDRKRKDKNPFGHKELREKNWPANIELPEDAFEKAIVFNAPDLFESATGKNKAECENEKAIPLTEQIGVRYKSINNIVTTLYKKHLTTTEGLALLAGAKGKGTDAIHKRVQGKILDDLKSDNDCKTKKGFKGIAFNPFRQMVRVVRENIRQKNKKIKPNPSFLESFQGYKKGKPKEGIELIREMNKEVEKEAGVFCKEIATATYEMCVAKLTSNESFTKNCIKGEDADDQLENYGKANRACQQTFHLLYWRCRNNRCFAIPDGAI